MYIYIYIYMTKRERERERERETTAAERLEGKAPSLSLLTMAVLEAGTNMQSNETYIYIYIMYTHYVMISHYIIL